MGGHRLDIRELLPAGRMLIGDEWVAATSGETIDVLDPATGEVLAAVPAGEAVDVDAAVMAAERGFQEWSGLSPVQRADRLYDWARLLTEHGEQIASLESMEVGRPYTGPSQVGRAVRYQAGLVDKVTGQTLPTDRVDFLGFTLREPLGVCAAIVPWNAPSVLMMKSVAPALAAGNAMVVKPAEDAPLTCALIGKLAREAGLPPGLLTIVTGYGATAGQALATHPAVRHMSFTGSAATGTAVMRACADKLIPVHLELGGKSPQIIMRDANLSVAIPSVVRFLTRNAGQICYAGTRLLVDRAIHDEVVALVADEMGRVRVGGCFDGAEMGPLINARQLRQVLDYIDIGTAEGASVVTGGHRLTGEPFAAGNFVSPTVFVDVDPTMRIAQEEIFGPVLSVIGFDDPEQALRIANGTEYGLAASVWTADVSQVVRFVKRLEAGQVYINTYGGGGAIGAPFGGYKRSGFGRTDGIDAILDYTQLKSVLIEGGL